MIVPYWEQNPAYDLLHAAPRGQLFFMIFER